jgi:hypothetical protein
MEKYEHPGEKIHSKAPTKEYKDNYEEVFGVKYRLFFSDGTQQVVKYPNKKEAEWAIHNEGDHVVGVIAL